MLQHHTGSGAVAHAPRARRAESSRLQAENAERSAAMQARLHALQALKDDVTEAARYVASLNKKVLLI